MTKMGLKSNPKTGEISIRGTIGDYEDMISAEDFIEVLAEHDGDLVVTMTSGGGVVTEGLAIYNALVNYQGGKTTVIVDAMCASIATVIACAGDEIHINERSQFMIHRAWTVAMGNCKDFRSMADLMDSMDGDIASVYSEKTGQNADVVLEKMDAETWMSPQQAKDFGFVDKILKVERPDAKESDQPEAVAVMGFSKGQKAIAQAAILRAKRILA